MRLKIVSFEDQQNQNNINFQVMDIQKIQVSK